ncbi:MAG: DUF4424 domain-containing protein [Alphaproteobacteria bacterium]|nr:DUF4424 domain-containing protein [Alphaproteobacteria bacterium]
MRSVLFSALLSFAAASAFANDSTAELATGGLVFVQNPNVEMRSEQLFISLQQVRVTYHFLNNSDQDVTNLVAFPLPDIVFDSPDSDIAIPISDSSNFLGFKTVANGRPVTTQVEQKVFAKGVDQTALLQQLGIPLAPQLPSTDAALDKLPRDQWQKLVDLGLGYIDEYDDTGTGMKQHLEPRWTLKTTFYWQQTFPAHQELVIEHEYQPSVGDSVETLIGNPQFSEPEGYKQKYCTDPDFLAAAAQSWQRANRANARPDVEQRIDYILSTGANWAGPIADFTLVVDKGAPANLVSFCANGVKKISPTQFQVHYTNFTPKSELAILILSPP